MKKLISKSVCIAFFGAALFAAATAGAQTTIYSGAFNTFGGLNGQTPTVTNGVLGGTAGATWAGGSSFWDFVGTVQGDNYTVAYLPFAAQSGEVYTLSANLTAGGEYVGLGFMQNLGTFGNLQSATAAGNCPFVDIQGPIGSPQALITYNRSTDVWSNLGTGTQGSLYSITLDTTGANWTYTISGAGITTPTVFTLAANSIAGIGIATGNVNSTVTNLSLTAAVPEPGTFAMLLGGVGMLTMFRRRRA